MESYYAKIEDNKVTFVEVVTDEFFSANPQRYIGKWIKVGAGSNIPFCGRDYEYLPEKDKIIPPKPFASWVLNADDIYIAPKPKPDGRCYWDEKSLNWIITT